MLHDGRILNTPAGSRGAALPFLPDVMEGNRQLREAEDTNAAPGWGARPSVTPRRSAAAVEPFREVACKAVPPSLP
jgi:hypothetical protein